MQRESRILLVAPYPELKTLAEDCCNLSGTGVCTEIGDLQDGTVVARAAESAGCEVIISRGGTARAIREAVSLPVIEIKVTGYDLLRVLYPAYTQGRRVAVVGFDNVVQGAKTICDTIGFKAGLFLVQTPSDAESRISEACEWGASLIVGDVVSTRTAEAHGLDVQLIMSGAEAVQYAIIEAFELLHHTTHEREQKHKLKAILDYSQEGIVSVDQTGALEFVNPAAAVLYGVTSPDVIGERAESALPNTALQSVLDSGHAELEQIRELGASRIVAHTVPISFHDNVHGAVEILQDVTRIQQLEQRIRTELHRKGLVAKHRFEDLVAESAAMQGAIRIARGFARTRSNVLLVGETGTGKELFAQSIHNAGKAADGPFVAVNCAALPGSLLESELFGYADGAFTGARKGGKQGLFELAHNGTVFLDEVTEMGLELQARFLRVVQEREVMRVGGDKVIPIRVRIIAATNQNLRDEVEQKRFRQDLYYRLKVLDLRIPPLRERGYDVVLLMEQFLRRFSKDHGIAPPVLSAALTERLLGHSWPGNVRELENLAEKIVAMVVGTPDVGSAEFDEGLILDELEVPRPGLPVDSAQSRNEAGAELREREREIILEVLHAEGFNQTRAAQRLGIDRGTLRRKLKNE